MAPERFLWLLPALPALGALACLAPGWRAPSRLLRLATAAGAAWSLLPLAAACAVLARGPLAGAGGWLRLDALSAWHALVLGLVFGSSSLYARGYFAAELAAGRLDLAGARRFGALWLAAGAAMSGVLVSNNLGLMWAGIEATTLLTAFLICVHVTPLSLEAMWKYVVVCSVGVAFALVGTLLTGAAASRLGLATGKLLLWTSLNDCAGGLAAPHLKIAFIFLLVGYGTKAGLAPLHSWLPDAHSQAPAPVSALFSGFMLNAGLYCLMRYLPLVEKATGQAGWGRGLLLLFGLVSIVVAAAFILFQRDGKRLLAYHSVEHLGIIALGLGLGGLGSFAALWHTLNHALCKALAFFAVGRLGQRYGSHDLHELAGALGRVPLWGAAFFAGILVLIGIAPFAIFMSELQLLRAAVAERAWTALAVFLLGTAIVFVGALRHALVPAWGEAVREPEPAPPPGLVDRALVALLLAALLLLGQHQPEPLRRFLEQAARALEGRP